MERRWAACRARPRAAPCRARPVRCTPRPRGLRRAAASGPAATRSRPPSGSSRASRGSRIALLARARLACAPNRCFSASEHRALLLVADRTEDRLAREDRDDDARAADRERAIAKRLLGGAAPRSGARASRPSRHRSMRPRAPRTWRRRAAARTRAPGARRGGQCRTRRRTCLRRAKRCARGAPRGGRRSTSSRRSYSARKRRGRRARAPCGCTRTAAAPAVSVKFSWARVEASESRAPAASRITSVAISRALLVRSASRVSEANGS